jgi:serine phosphatase RsbU (regulator of sigma subunit)
MKIKIRKILFPYIKEYDEAKTGIMRSRLRLFCGLTIGLFIGVGILGFVVDPVSYDNREIFIDIFLVAAALLAISVSRPAATLLQAKIAAWIFSLSVIAALTALFMIYPYYIMQSSEIFALSVFLISFIMPWEVYEVALTGLSFALGYSATFAWVAKFAPMAEEPILRPGGYVDGLIFLAVSIIICAVIRERDEAREKENFRLLTELEEKNEQMRMELALARDIHKTLIPRSTKTERSDIAITYIPLSTVGGDYATFHTTRDGSLFFLIGDVTGHGVPAALLVNRIYGEVESLVNKNPEPGPLMKELDSFVQEHFRQTNMYFSVCSGLVDFSKKVLYYSNYGHPPQILHRHGDNNIRLLESQTYFLGIDVEGPSSKIFEGKLDFGCGDRIVLFTDGLTETKGEEDELFGMKRLEDFVKIRAGETPAVFNNSLIEALNKFRIGPVTDDMFLVTIDIK